MPRRSRRSVSRRSRRSRRSVSRRSRRSVSRRSRSSRRSRRSAFAMYGGSQHTVNFEVDLDNIDASNDNNDMSAEQIQKIVSQNSNNFYDLFNKVVGEILEAGEIDSDEFKNFRFAHLDQNRFELTFDCEYQGHLSHQLLQETIDMILEKINEESITINGVIYTISAMV
jgi:hypothetical protein